MGITTLAAFACGDMLVTYHLDDVSGQVGLELCPVALADRRGNRRATLDGQPETDRLPFGHPFPAWRIEPLVQLSVRGDAAGGGFAQGRTMRNGATSRSLRFVGQEREDHDDAVIVTTTHTAGDLWCEHRLSWRAGELAARVRSRVENRGASDVTLEMFSSFTLGCITPFDSADAPGRLVAHRLRSSWSAEGRLDSQPVEALQLERSWSGHAALSERFGQVGSMPVRGFFPFVAVEDSVAGVTWAAQLAWAGSWQMELYRQGDTLEISGGLADREFGHWWKTLRPGEALDAPEARLVVVAGDVDDACYRLTQMQAHAADRAPASERDLPIIVNEWCSSWGNPTHENLVALAERLRGTPARYLVIDAGWYAGENGAWDTSHGDWIPSRRAFPSGIAQTAAAIRERGLIPGIWFEMETCGATSTAFRDVEHLLRRDGAPITAGGRRFRDLRDPAVVDELAERVIGLLREAGFGYLKVDYNETIGLGCDSAPGAGAESPGEGLRRQIEAVYAFFRRIRADLPDLVIENCSSGGHRAEPSMLALTDMCSFSDAHETPEIPLIAANVQRAMLPRYSQVWAVLRADDTPQRLVYSLAATFLGRMCLSGDLRELSDAQWQIARAAQDLYRSVWPVIKNGRSYRYGKIGAGLRHPHGWQGVLRVSDDQRESFAVVHCFQDAPARVELPLPAGNWRVEGELRAGLEPAQLSEGKLVVSGGDWTGRVAHLRRV